MNLGPEFLSGVLRILALFYGPPFLLAITAGILARWRQFVAAVVCWALAAIVLAGVLIVGPTQDGGWTFALPAALILALTARPIFRRRDEQAEKHVRLGAGGRR